MRANNHDFFGMENAIAERILRVALLGGAMSFNGEADKEVERVGT